MEIKIRYPTLLFLGLSVLFTIYVYFLLLFITAYYNPTKDTILSINKWGEADVEFVILGLTFPLVLNVIFLMYNILKQHRNESKK